MINVNDNTILNPENVVIAEQKGSMYKLTLINGKTLYVNKDVYEDIIAYEPVSKEYVDSKLSGALKRVIVETLPVEDIDINTIYMVLDTESSEVGNVYNEYLYINNAWELIGTTASSGPAYTAGTGIDITGNVISSTVKESYDHIIDLVVANSGGFQTGKIYTNLSTKSNEPFYKNVYGNTFCQYLYTNGFTSNERELNANGYITTNNKNYIILGVYAQSNSNLAFSAMDPTDFSITTLVNAWYGSGFYMTDKVV